jgi:hypothetical protein
MCRVRPLARESSGKLLRVECKIGKARSGEIEASVEGDPVYAIITTRSGNWS